MFGLWTSITRSKSNQASVPRYKLNTPIESPLYYELPPIDNRERNFFPCRLTLAWESVYFLDRLNSEHARSWHCEITFCHPNDLFKNRSHAQTDNIGHNLTWYVKRMSFTDTAPDKCSSLWQGPLCPCDTEHLCICPLSRKEKTERGRLTGTATGKRPSLRFTMHFLYRVI